MKSAKTFAARPEFLFCSLNLLLFLFSCWCRLCPGCLHYHTKEFLICSDFMKNRRFDGKSATKTTFAAYPGVVNQWFPIDWLQSIQSIIINNNPLIVIDWCNQSIKIDTHTRSLNCYWLPLITIENHWLIIHYATFWRVLAWACFIGPGHIYTSRVIG